MMMSCLGWGLLTGQMVSRLGSVSCATCLPVEASSKSMGCSATPPKSSLIYLTSNEKIGKSAHMQKGLAAGQWKVIRDEFAYGPLRPDPCYVPGKICSLMGLT